MDVSLKHPGALTPDEVSAWRVLRASDDRYDSPFLAPEFALAVGLLRTDARILQARTARGIFPLADKASDEPTADLLTQRLTVHEQTAWMLRSLLED